MRLSGNPDTLHKKWRQWLKPALAAGRIQVPKSVKCQQLQCPQLQCQKFFLGEACELALQHIARTPQAADEDIQQVCAKPASACISSYRRLVSTHPECNVGMMCSSACNLWTLGPTRNSGVTTEMQCILSGFCHSRDTQQTYQATACCQSSLQDMFCFARCLSQQQCTCHACCCRTAGCCLGTGRTTGTERAGAA